MLPASTKGGGQCFGFPDVCKVPAPPAPFVPTPFPNIAMPNQASGGTCSSKVKIDGKETIVKGTEIPMSKGDEAGTLGGMISAVNMNKVTYKVGSSRVKFEGKQACHLTSMTAHNGANANFPPGAQIAPSQTKVTVIP
jgi:uncharacterized Zn-binding protein involved in type VI secretion